MAATICKCGAAGCPTCDVPVTQDNAAHPRPKLVQLPCGGSMNVFTREQMTQLYHCTHGELGRLLCRKQAPMPVRIEGTILWYTDEALAMHAQVARTLERWRRR